MKNHKNSIIAKKWLQLILSVYKGKKPYFLKNSEAQRSISEKEAEIIANEREKANGYINLNQKDEDKKLLKEVNSILENSLEDVIIQNFYENIDLVMNELKINIHNEEEKEKDKEKDKDKENEKNNNPMNNSNIENKMNESNELHSNNAFSHIEENIINIKEDSKKQIDSTYSTYQELVDEYGKNIVIFDRMDFDETYFKYI